MSVSHVEYTKVILEKVMFDDELFDKELKKAMYWMTEMEKQEIRQWIRHKLKRQHKSVEPS
jgi:hypothetical protein